MSTKDHKHYRQDFIAQEVSDLSAFKTSDSSVQAARENAATKHLEIDTEYDRDAIAKAKENIEISKGIKEGRLDPKVYRGLHGYQNYFEQTEEDLKRKQFSGTLGPVRAPTFIRNTTRVDYNPERCKDYYETGRCNFGDSCIFIHDRSDYKSGWQLDQEFEAEQKRKQMRLMGHEVDDGEENYEIHSQQDDGCDSDGFPLVCRICENVFRSPIQTQCGHYFCEQCALSHYSSSGNCFTCGKPTNGIFNDAPKLAKKVQKIGKPQETSDHDNNNDQDDQDSFDATTQAATKINQQKEQDLSGSDEGGVFSKEDRLVMQEYKEQRMEGERRKYVPQTGWYIP